MDNDLPFYVHTLNERYRLEEQPSFDEPGPQHMSRLYRLVRRSREDASIITGGRALLPVKHSTSIRHRFHKITPALIDVPGNFEERIKALRDRGLDEDADAE